MAKDFNIGNLCALTSAGLEVANFVQVRDAVIARYKNVYGSDIDLSTASADGVFVNDICIIINNILQTMKTMYSNLDVNSASGVYLDTLCKLSNVRRKGATKSTASLLVTNLNPNEMTFADVDNNDSQLTRLTFVDKAGTEWVYNNSLTLAGNASTMIDVTCVEDGPVKAPAGWIVQTMLVMELKVQQDYDAIVGETEETDQQLRKRRSQSSGADGVAVLESLVGALLENVGIKDVKIYNNNSLSTIAAKDGTEIAAHCIYVILRELDTLENFKIPPETIGNIIFNKLTPGIKTVKASMSETTTNSGVNEQYEYIPQMLGQAIINFNQFAYWKRAIPIHPTITVKIKPTQYFATNEFEDIFNAIKEYTDNIQLSTDINIGELFMNTYESDPYFKGQATFSVVPANVTVAATENPDTYYKYTTWSVPKDNSGNYQKTDDYYVITIE